MKQEIQFGVIQLTQMRGGNTVNLSMLVGKDVQASKRLSLNWKISTIETVKKNVMQTHYARVSNITKSLEVMMSANNTSHETAYYSHLIKVGKIVIMRNGICSTMRRFLVTDLMTTVTDLMTT